METSQYPSVHYLHTGWPTINHYTGAGLAQGGITDLVGIFCRDSRLTFLVELMRQITENNPLEPADGYQETGLVLFTSNTEYSGPFDPAQQRHEFGDWSVWVYPVEPGSFTRAMLQAIVADLKIRGVDVRGVFLDALNELAFDDVEDYKAQKNSMERLDQMRQHYHTLREFAKSHSVAMVVLRPMYYGLLELPEPPRDSFSPDNFEYFPLLDPMRRLAYDVDTVLAICPDKPESPHQLRIRIDKSRCTWVSSEVFKHSEIRLEVDEQKRWWESEVVELL